MWKQLIVAFGAFLAVCWSMPAFACDCSSPTAAIPVKSSNLEVWGIATRVVQAKTGELVRFDVLDILFDKDNKAPTNIVIQDPAYCGIGFEEGKAYVMRGLELRTENLYLTNSCAGTRAIATPPGTAEQANSKLERVESSQQTALNQAATLAARVCKDDAGGRPFHSFLLSVAPEDDPLIIDLKSAIESPSNCTGEQMLENVAALSPDQPLVVSGSTLFEETPRGMVDVWSCSADDCPSFSKQMEERLLVTAPPLTEAQARTLAKQMHHITDRDPSVEIARTLCRLDGVDAAEKFARNNKLVGGPRWNAELQAMIFECTVATRNFEQARTLMQTTSPGPAFSIAFEWMTKAEDLTPPIRKGAPTLAETLGDQSLLAARQAFVRTQLWENDPVMLEAFAQAVASDPKAPASVRKLGALAYHKAALFHPEAAEAYAGFAHELATDEELGETLATLRTNFQAALDSNDARTSLAERAAAEQVEQLDLEESQTTQANTRRGPILKDDPDREMDLDWGSLALHLLVVVGSLSIVAFFASRSSR